MTIDEILETLKKLNIILTGRELAEIWGMSEEHVSRTKKAHKQVKAKYIEILEKKFDINLIKKSLAERLAEGMPMYAAKINPDIIEIPYWEGLPDELKHSEYSHVVAQKASIELGWKIKAEYLRIVPMVGDKMANYWYRINDGDILIIDTSHNHIRGNGVYFATSRDNSRFWVREMQALINDDVQIKSFAPSGEITKIFTPEQLKEVGFKIIGKVVKNVSFRL